MRSKFDHLSHNAARLSGLVDHQYVRTRHNLQQRQEHRKTFMPVNSANRVFENGMGTEIRSLSSGFAIHVVRLLTGVSHWRALVASLVPLSGSNLGEPQAK